MSRRVSIVIYTLFFLKLKLSILESTKQKPPQGIYE